MHSKRSNYHTVGECELTNNHREEVERPPPDGLFKTAEERQQPLALSHPAAYWTLVHTVYRSSYAIILGNMLEWLDFGIFGYSEQEISQQLFAGSHAVGWIIFGLGYAVRPVGACLLGRIADQVSRKLSFMLSIIGMATATACMSLIPAVCDQQQQPAVTTTTSTQRYCVAHVYQTAILAVILRIVQGLSAGGAAGGVSVIQSELWSTSERRAAITQSVGVNNVSGAAASMLAAGVVLGLKAVLGGELYSSVGWRVAFLIVIPPSLLSSYLTNAAMPESNDYAEQDGHLDQERDDALPDKPHQHPQPLDESHLEISLDSQNSTPMWLLLVVSIYIQFTIAAYNNLNVYLVQYAQENYGVSDDVATLMVLVGKAVQIFMTLPAAWMGDVKGWFWTAALGGVLCAVLAVPMMAASRLGGLHVAWALVAIVEPAVATLWILTAPLLATCIFPVSIRSKWTSMVMATGVAAAGFFPLLLDLLDGIYVSGYVLAVVAALGAACILWIRDRAKKGRVEIYQRPDLY